MVELCSITQSVVCWTLTSVRVLVYPALPGVTNLAAAAIDLVLLRGDFDQFLANGGGGIVGLIWILITIVPAIGVLVRRLHDTGRSGRWALIGFVPIVGTIVLLVFTLQDSEAAENTYGVSPKAQKGV